MSHSPLSEREDRGVVLTRERDAARAESVSRGRMLKRCRDRLINARDGLDDQGDLVAFGSTNDADRFREVVEELDAFSWDLIIAEKGEPDLIEQCRRSNARSRADRRALLALRSLVVPSEVAEAENVLLRLDAIRVALSGKDLHLARNQIRHILDVGVPDSMLADVRKQRSAR